MSKADEYLLDAIERGDADAWRAFVKRYQGRLIAFARARTQSSADAEDAVQETLLALVRSLGQFRRQASLETYLFTILRRKIVDLMRSRGRPLVAHVCSLQADSGSDEDGQGRNFASVIASEQDTASWYVERHEQAGITQEALRTALLEQINALKHELRFRELKICDLIFQAQMRNQEIASLLELEENYVAVRKHRFIKRISEAISDLGIRREQIELNDSMLTSFWETQRPSCPKRSTIGKYLLQTLEDNWQEYVHFHTSTLGCHFCVANLEDLRQRTATPQNLPSDDRLFQSTVGFFRRQSGTG